MKVQIIGNVVNISSNINFEELKRATSKDPILLKNTKGETIYGALVAPVGTISPLGVTFTYANAESNAALNICLTPDFTSVEDAKNYVLDNLTEELINLQAYEEMVNTSLAAEKEARDSLAETITVG